MKTLYMLRHGETDMNRELRCQGRIDIPLNETGKKQAADAADFFENIKIDAIFSSPLVRAIVGARAVAAKTGLEPEILEWLSEINHGEVEGMNREEAQEKFPGLLDTWMNNPLDADFPGGEKLVEVVDRVRTGLLRLMKEKDGTVLLVTHQIISSVARCLILNIPLSRVWEDKLVNGDHYRFDLNGETVGNLEKYAV